jgi:SAM-dependent methyltransferase
MSSTSSIEPGDSLRTNELYPTWNNIIPLPPQSLLWSVGGSSLELFLLVGDAWMQPMASYIQAGISVLDIGCGCGRSARTLLRNSNVTRYVGFDLIPENIDWCRRFIEPMSGGHACFLHYDIYSAEYRPQGTLRASDLRFACDDGSVDLIIALSLLAHLLDPDVAHYLREIGRVISARGHALLSIHTDTAVGKPYTGTETVSTSLPIILRKLPAEANLTPERKTDLCGKTLLVFPKNHKEPVHCSPASLRSL